MAFTEYRNSNFENTHFVEFRYIDEYDPDTLLKIQKYCLGSSFLNENPSARHLSCIL